MKKKKISLKVNFVIQGQLLLFVATHRGLLKVLELCTEGSTAKIDGVGDVIDDGGDDALPISSISVASIHQSEIVVVTKNHCLFTYIVTGRSKNADGGGPAFSVAGPRMVALPTLQISGRAAYLQEYFENYQLF